MKHLFKPACLLLYLLTFIVFFFLGILYVNISGVTEGQGLAAGAIGLMNALLFSLAGLVAAFIFCHHAALSKVIWANRIMVLALVIVIAILSLRWTGHSPAGPESDDPPIGLGFFRPDFYQDSVLYFYSRPNLEKAVSDHMPFDSVVFRQTEYGGFDISYAPPWLQPDHLKMDYEILYFRLQTMHHDFLEVTVNTRDQRTFFVNRYAGKVIFWPEFLLATSAIEWRADQEQPIRIKPLEHAGEVRADFEFLKPIAVKDEWIQVELVDRNYKVVDKGWVRWRKGDKLLVGYALLS